MLMQILAGAAGSIGFAILYNVRGRALAFALLGGALGWTVYLLTGGRSPHDLPNYLYAAMSVALYSEVLARLLKTPVSAMLAPSVIPMIPGGSLYYTMASCLRGDYADFTRRGLYTIMIAAMLALGVMSVMVVTRAYVTLHRRLAGK